MNELINVGIGLLCGTIFLLGFYLQIKILKRLFQIIYIKKFLKIIFSSSIVIIFSIIGFIYSLLLKEAPDSEAITVVIVTLIVAPFSTIPMAIYSEKFSVYLFQLFSVFSISGFFAFLPIDNYLTEIYIILITLLLLMYLTTEHEAYFKKFNDIKDKQLRVQHLNNISSKWKSTITFPLIFILSIFFLVTFGEVSYFILNGIDTNDFSNFSLEISISTAILCLAFFLKSLFSILTIFTTLMWFIWGWLINDQFTLSPLFLIILDSTSETLPLWVKTLYVFLTLIYTLFNTLKNSIDLKNTINSFSISIRGQMFSIHYYSKKSII